MYIHMYWWYVRWLLLNMCVCWCTQIFSCVSYVRWQWWNMCVCSHKQQKVCVRCLSPEYACTHKCIHVHTHKHAAIQCTQIHTIHTTQQRKTYTILTAFHTRENTMYINTHTWQCICTRIHTHDNTGLIQPLTARKIHEIQRAVQLLPRNAA